MDKAKTGPKDFFMWAGAMVALYWSVSSFIFLIFDYINFAYPDPLNYYVTDPYQSGVSFEMSSLIVLFPVFIVLMWLIHRDIVRDHSRSEIWVRRWALMLTLFIAALSMVIDLVVLVHSFLNGDTITVAFILKVLVVLGVAAVAFMHFIADLWGYWEKYPARGHAVGYAAAFLLVLSVGSGFLILGTPAHARLIRLDYQKVSDLQNIQSQVISYYQTKQKLPTNLMDLNNSLSYQTIPLDPQSGTDYDYHISTPPYHFELCAVFNAAGSGDQYGVKAVATVPTTVHTAGGLDNWAHSDGNVCFERTIDPELYPPTTNNNVPIKPVQ